MSDYARPLRVRDARDTAAVSELLGSFWGISRRDAKAQRSTGERCSSFFSNLRGSAALCEASFLHSFIVGSRPKCRPAPRPSRFLAPSLVPRHFSVSSIGRCVGEHEPFCTRKNGRCEIFQININRPACWRGTRSRAPLRGGINPPLRTWCDAPRRFCPWPSRSKASGQVLAMRGHERIRSSSCTGGTPLARPCSSEARAVNRFAARGRNALSRCGHRSSSGAGPVRRRRKR